MSKNIIYYGEGQENTKEYKIKINNAGSNNNKNQKKPKGSNENVYKLMLFGNGNFSHENFESKKEFINDVKNKGGGIYYKTENSKYEFSIVTENTKPQNTTPQNNENYIIYKLSADGATQKHILQSNQPKSINVSDNNNLLVPINIKSSNKLEELITNFEGFPSTARAMVYQSLSRPDMDGRLKKLELFNKQPSLVLTNSLHILNVILIIVLITIFGLNWFNIFNFNVNQTENDMIRSINDDVNEIKEKVKIMYQSVNFENSKEIILFYQKIMSIEPETDDPIKNNKYEIYKVIGDKYFKHFLDKDNNEILIDDSTIKNFINYNPSDEKHGLFSWGLLHSIIAFSLDESDIDSYLEKLNNAINNKYGNATQNNLQGNLSSFTNDELNEIFYSEKVKKLKNTSDIQFISYIQAISCNIYDKKNDKSIKNTLLVSPYIRKTDIQFTTGLVDNTSLCFSKDVRLNYVKAIQWISDSLEYKILEP